MSLTLEVEKPIVRRNYIEFLEALKNLHKYLKDLATTRSELSDGSGGVEFNDVKSEIQSLLEQYGTIEERLRRWIDAQFMWRPLTS